MATIITHAESTRRRRLLVPRLELLDVLRAAGKLPPDVRPDQVDDVAYDDDDGLTVEWTERRTDDVQEDV